jgi:hypothetical protein
MTPPTMWGTDQDERRGEAEARVAGALGELGAHVSVPVRLATRRVLSPLLNRLT